MALFDVFPYLTDGKIIIKKMEECDVQALRNITDNTNVYRFIPHFLYKKSVGNLLAAIKNCGGRDFEKHKHIIAGIYLAEESKELIGIAEMFDYKKRKNSITIGYKVNENYWHQGIATSAVALMKQYLISDGAITEINAYVMPENIYSEKVLLSNGFMKMPEMIEQKNWGDMDLVPTNHFVYIES